MSVHCPPRSGHTTLAPTERAVERVTAGRPSEKTEWWPTASAPVATDATSNDFAGINWWSKEKDDKGDKSMLYIQEQYQHISSLSTIFKKSNVFLSSFP